MLTVPLNVGPPTSIQITLQSPVFGPDLTTVTAVNLGVVRRDGTTATWACEILSATTRELVVRYTFSGTELTSTGAFILGPQLTLPGGVVPAESVVLFVSSANAVQPQTETDAWVLATSSVAGNATRFDWSGPYTAPIAANPLFPFVLLDQRSGTVGVTLWQGTGGDPLTLFDPYAAGHNFSLTPTGGQAVYYKGAITTGATAISGLDGPLCEIKFSKNLNAWMVL
jgi:hypothetical protein